MSGRRIDDHSSWVGKAAAGEVFPNGAKRKKEDSADVAGSLARYEDTTEAIRSQQEKGTMKIHGHPRKDDFRN